ncbi:membrane protein [Lacticaseibacillus rhamnosus]|nr:membrane protein [Lacticaseibacillus rhamnosus]
MRLFQDPYFVTAMKLLLGFIVFIAQIKLTGKGNLAPATIVDQMQNYVLGGIIGGVIYNTDIGLLQFVNVLLIWTLIVFSTKYLTNHNRWLKRVIDGEPLLVVQHGQIKVDTATQVGLSANDLSYKLRAAGVNDLRDVRQAYLEQNGQLNVILKGDETIKYPLILDGQIDPAALDAIDHDEKWLKDRLAEQGYEPGDVYMASFLGGRVVVSPYDRT